MFKMSTRVYTILKWGVIIFLPACSVFYTAMSKIWGFPMADQVSQTISAICVFLGSILCISSAEYRRIENEGTVQVIEQPIAEPVKEPIEEVQEEEFDENIVNDYIDTPPSSVGEVSTENQSDK